MYKIPLSFRLSRRLKEISTEFYQFAVSNILSTKNQTLLPLSVSQSLRDLCKRYNDRHPRYLYYMRCKFFDYHLRNNSRQFCNFIASRKAIVRIIQFGLVEPSRFHSHKKNELSHLKRHLLFYPVMKYYLYIRL